MPHRKPTIPLPRSFLALALAAFTALVALTAAPQAAAQTAQNIFSNSSLIPDVDNISPGDSFRLLFLTSATVNAVPDGIGPYNTHVQGAAADGHVDIQRFSTQFRALVSVGINNDAIITARDNTKTNDKIGKQETPDPSVPIYWLNGAKVADNNADFYDNGWGSRVARNEHGNLVANPSEVWTGSLHTGAAVNKPGNPVMHGLSVSTPRVGRLSGSGGPINAGQDRADSTLRPLYAVSPVLNVVAIADTTLSALSFEGTSVFTPAFDSATTSYAARVAHDVTSIMVTPTTTDPIATATISATHNGEAALASTPLARGAGASVPLSEGLTLISITVSASTTYTVSVRRVAPPPPAPEARKVLVGTPLASGLGIGEQFRMLFVTSDKRNGNQSDLDLYYNVFVQRTASRSTSVDLPIAAFSDQFRVLASSATVDARDNTATTGAGVPIYWLGGDKVADDYADLYDGSWDSLEARDETGTAFTAMAIDQLVILTGSTDTGVGSPNATIGNTPVRIGRLDRGFGSEINSESGDSTVKYHLYALSPVLTVVTDAPVVQTPIPDQTATAQALFSYAFPSNTFYDLNNALSYNNNALSYSVTGLPSWLTFQPADVAAASRPRTLRGTPPSSAVEQSPFTITVTASDGDQATADVSDTFTLTVSSALEFDTRYIPLPAASYTYTVGVSLPALNLLPRTRGGLAPLTYTLHPADALPAGITYNPSPRSLSGTPTETAAPVALTYAVTDANLSVITLTFSLGVVASPTLDSIADQVYTINQPVDFTLPEATGGAASLSYTLVRTNGSPVLPPGLAFDPAARTISGATTYVFGGTNGAALRYTATDANGAAAAQDFTLRTVAAPAFSATATIAALTYTAGTPIAPLTLPEATGGATPLTYSLTPAASVPPGLTLNPTTRVLSGAPVFAVTNAALTYIVTDINGATDTLSFNLTVAATFGFDITAIPAPDAAYQYIINQPITPLTLPPVTGGTGTLTYALDGVPAGLTFSAGARTLSGAPAAAVDDAALTYTVTDSAASPNSVALTFMVSAASQPTVTSVTAVVGTPDDLYITGEEVNIIIQFSEDVTITGTPQLALDTGNSDGNGGTAEYVSASNPVTALFSYTVRAGDNTAALAYTGTDALTLNGGTIRNTADTVDADLTLPTVGSLNSLSGNTAVTLDTTAPVFTSGDTANVVVGTALTFTVYDAEATNNGGAADAGVTYSLSGTDAGLFSIDPASGVVTYIAVQNDVVTHRIVVTAINMLGNPTTQIVDISVLAVPVPDITDSALSEYTNGVTTFTFTWHEMVNDFEAGDIAVDGGIPGTFTETTAGTIYTLVVTPNANINDGTITVTVDANVVTGALTNAGNDRTIATQKFDTVAPVFAPNTDTVNFAVNTPIGTAVYNAAATDGDGVADAGITYSLSDADAAQFAIGVNNGRVTLTSPSMAAHTFVITATDKGGNTDTITVTVSSALAFYTRFYPVPTAPYIYTVGVPIPPLNLPPVRGGRASLTYTLHPADASFPEGLTFNLQPYVGFTHILSGTPTETATSVALTYAVTDANSVATLTFSLSVVASPTLESIDDQVYTIPDPVNFALPEAIGGAAPLSYTLMRIRGSPLLPPGLDFDPDARTISGMPTVAFGGVNGAALRYTATDANGAAVALTFMVSAVDTVVPIFTRDSGSTDRAQITVATGTTPATTVHDANATDNGRAADIGITYTLDDTAAAFSFDMATGVLTPKATLTEAATYSVDITATDEVGNEATQYLTIVVSDRPTVGISSNVGIANTATIADGALTFTFTFSEDVDFDADDITATGGGNKGAFAGTGSVYTLVVPPTAGTNDGVLTISVAEGVATSTVTGRTNLAADTATQAYDTQAPTAPTIESVAGDNNEFINAVEAAATDGVLVTGTTGVIGSETGSDTRTVTLCAVPASVTATPSDANPCGVDTMFTADTTDTATTWSYSLTTADITALGEGSVTLTAIAADAAGNTAVSSGRAITVDTVAPPLPTFNTVNTDNIIDRSNTFGNAADCIGRPLSHTDSDCILFSGDKDSNTEVTIFFGGSDNACTGGASGDPKQVGSTWFYVLPNSDGNTLDVLGQGEVSVCVTAEDDAGNPSTATHRLTVDTVPPTAPTIDAALIAGDDIINAAERTAGVAVTGTTGVIGSDTSSVILCAVPASVTATPSDDNPCGVDTMFSADTTDTATTWSYSLTTQNITDLGEGSVTLTAIAADSVGNTAASSVRDITVDTTAPVFVRASESTNRAQVAAAIGADTDTTVHDAMATDNNRAHDTGITYALAGADSATFALTTDSGILTPAAATTLDMAATYSVDITATDDAGNETTQYLAIVVSDRPTVTISSNVGLTNTATIADGVLTFTFSWREAVTGFTVEDITVTETIGTTTTDITGLSLDQVTAERTYTLEVTPTPNTNNGLIRVNVRADAVTSTATSSTNPPTTATQAYDTQAPAEPSIGDVATDDIINFAEANEGVVVTGTTGVIGSDTDTITLCAGATSATDATCTGGTPFTVTAAAATTWSYTLITQNITDLGEGTFTLTAIATDAAGNTAVSAGQPITVDTVVPAAPVFASGPLEINILFRQTNSNVFLVGESERGTTVNLCFGGSGATCTSGLIREKVLVLGGTLTERGSWSYSVLPSELDALGQGDVSVLATATDEAGNPSAVGTSDIITIDLTAPVFTSGGTVSVAVGAATTFTVYEAVATDDYSITYTLSGTDAGLFDIDPATGAVTFRTSPSTAATHRITVTATDTVDNRTTRNVTISVLAAPEPEITDSALSEYTNGVTTFTFTWNEMVSGFETGDITVDGGGTKGAFTGTDPGMVYTLVVTPPTTPTNDGVLTVTVAANAVTGALTKTGNAAATAEQKYDNMAPVFTSGDTATFAVNTPINTAFYTAVATDGGGDADDDITYSLSDADFGRFSIFSDGGVIYFDRPSIGPDTFEITATDRGGNTDTITVTVTVTPSNDATLRELSIILAGGSVLSLTPSGGSTPGFDSGVFTYTAAAPGGTPAVTMAATPTDGNASIEYAVGSPATATFNTTGALNVDIGTNTLTARVTAEDGTTTLAYTIILTVPVDPASIDTAQQTQIVPADWALIPDQDGVTGPDFDPGESFRLLFTTSGVSDATSSVIADYNAFVQTDASLATGIGMPIRPFSAKFRALISTAAMDARDNTGTNPDNAPPDIDAPIYWLGNEKVAGNYTGFYDGHWDFPSVFRNRDGDVTQEFGLEGVVVWTGTDGDGTGAEGDGTGAEGFQAGQMRVAVGQISSSGGSPGATLNGSPAGHKYRGKNEEYYLYALSPVFIVQPDTALNALRVTPSGGLAPVFDTAVFTYTATAPAGTTTVTVAAMATDTNADIQYAVGDPSTAMFTDSSTLTVVDGNNVLTVRVIAGSTSQDYTIMLNVGAIDQVPPTVESVTYFSDEAATTTITEALINTNVYVVVQFSENVENRVTVRTPNPSDIVAGQPVLLVRTQNNFPMPPVVDDRFEIIAHATSFAEDATQCRAESATDTSRYLCQKHLTPATLRAGPVNIRVLAQGPPVGSGVRPFTQDLAGNRLAGDGVNEGTDYTDSPGINAIVPDAPTVDSVTHYPTAARTAEISGPVVSGDIYSLIQFTGAAISFNIAEPVQTPPDARPQIFYQIGTEMRMQFGVTARTGVPAAGTCRLFTGIEQDSENSKFWCRYATKRGDAGLYKIIVGTETRDVNGEHLAAEYTGDTGVTLAVVAGDAALTMADVNGMADVSVREGDGSAAITVTLDTAVTSGFTVDVSTMDGIAVAPDDYTALTGHTLTFAGTANETQTFSVTIIDDEITENEQGEPLTLALGNIVFPPGITTEIAIDTATLTITDDPDDISTLTIEDVSVREGAGAAVVSVQLEKALYTGFTVRVATADDSAVAPGDYTAITAHTLTFAGNADETQTFSVTISDDNIAELDETLTVSLNLPVFNSIDGIHRDGISRLIVTDTATVTIVDNELTFSVATIDDQDWVVGTAVNLTLPAATGGNGTLSYTLTPPAAIPDGLTFNPVARTLDGTPTAVTLAAALTYTATDSDSTAPVAPIALTFSAAVRAAGTDAMLNALTVTPSGATDALTFTQSDGTTTGFATAELTYTATARVGTTTVAVVATTNDGAATYTITGTAADGNTDLGVTRTTTGGAVSGLTAGDNTITVTVTAADGTTMRVYTITLTVQEPIVLTGLPSGADLTLEYGAAASEFGLTLNPVSAREITRITATSNGVVTAEVLDNGSYNSGGEGRYVLSVTPPDTGTTYTDTVTITATAVGHTTFTQDIPFTIVDATLSALSVTPSGGGETLTLTPTFATATTFIAYTATARVGTTTVAVTATTNDGAATYTITGTAADGNTDLGVTSTTTGGDVSGLTAGDNVITVTVTAENGTTMRVYTITLTVRATASNDATLNALTVTPIGGSAVTLTPVFDAATTTYTATAPSATTAVAVVATTNDGAATYTITGTAADGNTALGVTSTTTGGAVSGLTVGDNTITITVTAEDRSMMQTYTITLTVLEALVFASTVADQRYSTGIAITALTLPEASGGIAPLTYTLSPAADIPSGLTFAPAARTLSGTPTEVVTQTLTYTVTDSAVPPVSTALTFTIKIVREVTVAAGDTAIVLDLDGDGATNDPDDGILTLPTGHTVTAVTIDLPPQAATDNPPPGITFGLTTDIALDMRLPADATATVCLPTIPSGRDPVLYHDTSLGMGAATWTEIGRDTATRAGYVCGETATFSPFAVGYAAGASTVVARLNEQILTRVAQAVTAGTLAAVAGRVESMGRDGGAPAPSYHVGGQSSLRGLMEAHGASMLEGEMQVAQLLDGASFVLSLSPTRGRSIGNPESSPDDSPELITDDGLDDGLDGSPELITDDGLDDGLDDSPELITDDGLDDGLDGSPELITDDGPDDSLDGSPELITDDGLDDGLDGSPELITDDGPDDSSDLIPERSPDRSTGHGGGLSMWGKSEFRGLDSGDSSDAIDWSGDMLSTHVGVDRPVGRDKMAGIALSWNRGNFDYEDETSGIHGDYQYRTTNFNPYFGWLVCENIRLWGMAGYGRGEIEISEVDTDGVRSDDSTDIDHLSLAGGFDGRLLSSNSIYGGVASLALKGDMSLSRVTVEEFEFGEQGIAAQEVGSYRLRLLLGGEYQLGLHSGGMLTELLEVGGRYDGGDGMTGGGFEVGGGLRYVNPGRDLTIEGNVRTLLAHQYDEWGIDLRVQLSPSSGRGLSVNVRPVWGKTQSVAERLWNDGAVDMTGDAVLQGSLDAEVGYGMAASVMGASGLLTPYMGMTVEDDGGNRLRFGGRFSGGRGLSVKLEGTQDNAADGVSHTVLLRGELAF